MPDSPKHSISRRGFLTIAGTAGLALGCSPGAGPQKLIPYLTPPEHIFPGRRCSTAPSAASAPPRAVSRLGRAKAGW